MGAPALRQLVHDAAGARALQLRGDVVGKARASPLLARGRANAWSCLLPVAVGASMNEGVRWGVIAHSAPHSAQEGPSSERVSIDRHRQLRAVGRADNALSAPMCPIHVHLTNTSCLAAELGPLAGVRGAKTALNVVGHGSARAFGNACFGCCYRRPCAKLLRLSPSIMMFIIPDTTRYIHGTHAGASSSHAALLCRQHTTRAVSVQVAYWWRNVTSSSLKYSLSLSSADLGSGDAVRESIGA